MRASRTLRGRTEPQVGSKQARGFAASLEVTSGRVGSYGSPGKAPLRLINLFANLEESDAWQRTHIQAYPTIGSGARR
ncbi:hypothetical protein DSM21852_20970 [Methylocystis bryophila]|nr:hypothetical protein DSM21852_20970 [Methylocystis bryophila]